MTNCPNCGAPIKSNSYKCEYCGTTYDNSDQQVLKYEEWLNYEYEQLRQIADMERVRYQVNREYELVKQIVDSESKPRNKSFKHLKALWMWLTK